MWTNPLTIALVAVGSTLMTIFLTPWLQRHFWRKQRRDELRLAAINELNRLAAEFLYGHIDAAATFRPSADWHKAFTTLDTNIKALFPKRGYAAFARLGVLIGPSIGGGLGPEGKESVHDFVAAREATMRALYDEVI